MARLLFLKLCQAQACMYALLYSVHVHCTHTAVGCTCCAVSHVDRPLACVSGLQHPATAHVSLLCKTVEFPNRSCGRCVMVSGHAMYITPCGPHTPGYYYPVFYVIVSVRLVCSRCSSAAGDSIRVRRRLNCRPQGH
jgi:hypothetical protein